MSRKDHQPSDPEDVETLEREIDAVFRAQTAAAVQRPEQRVNSKLVNVQTQ